MSADTDGGDILVTIFGRLFESDLGHVERLSVSVRMGEGMRTLDVPAALGRLLGEGGHPEPTPDPLHRTLFDAFPEYSAAVSGVAPYLRDLLLTGMDLPQATSMMRKRGVNHLPDHLVTPDALTRASLESTLEQARAGVTAKGARHVLLLVTDGTVHVAGRTPEETMAHWSNVEFSARVGCMRVEERLVHALER